MKKTVRIFISSPSDVEIERQVAMQVIQRLARKYANSLELKPVLWEREPLLASGHFQDALDPKTAEIMVCMLWSRLGSPLPENYKGTDGRTGITGSEWEFEHALLAHKETGKPELLVYRKTARVSADLDDVNAAQQALEQKKQVEQFFNKHFFNQDQGNTLKRAYFPFQGTDEFEQLLETHLQPLIEAQLKDDEHKAQITWHEGSPFLGLEAFSEKHHAVFFGRTKATSEIITQYQRQIEANRPFIMVSGMSGCGKSSLINASLLPLIRTPRVISYAVGYVHIIHLGSKTLLNEKGPTQALCDLLVSEFPRFEEIGIDSETLKEQINQSPKSLYSSLKQIIQSMVEKQNLHKNVTAVIQLVIDQGEELFTNKWFTKEHQMEFWAGIQALINTGFIWCIGSIRSDFVGQGHKTDLFQLMQGDGDYKLQPPTANELRQIIEQPAKSAGIEFELKNNLSLAEVILQDSQSQDGALPLVEFCLDELFHLANKDNPNRLVFSFEHYEQTLGGIAGAISQRAESATKTLKDKGVDVDALLPKLFNALIQLNPDTPSLAATARTVQKTYFDERHSLAEIVETFVNARLLIVNEYTVRIAHETLLSSWQRITQWLIADKEFQIFKARIDRDLSAWIQDNKTNSRLLQTGKPLNDAQTWLSYRRDDLSQKSIEFIEKSVALAKRKSHQKIALVSGVLISLSALTVYSWQQQMAANQHRQRAEILLDKVRENVDFMDVELRDVLIRFVPSAERFELIQQLDDLSDALFLENANETPRDLASRANVLLEKAELILLNDEQDPTQAQELIEQAFAIRSQLSSLFPDNLKLQLDFIDAHNDLGHLYERLGEYGRAHETLRTALKKTKELRSKQADNTEVLDMLSRVYQAIAFSYLDLNNTAKAIESAEQSILITEALYAEREQDVELKIQMYNALSVYAEIQKTIGNALIAFEGFKKAIDAAESLLTQQPNNMVVLDDLSHLYERMADAQQESISLQDAAKSLNRSIELSQQLVSLDPQNRNYQQALSGAYFRLGNVYEQMNQLDESLEAFSTSLEIDKKLFSLDPTSNNLKRELAYDYDSMGYILLLMGNEQEALTYTSTAVDMIRDIVKSSSGTMSLQADLGSILLHHGDVHRELQMFEKAQSYYDEALSILRNMLEQEPLSAKHRDDLALLLERKGMSFFDAGDYELAIEHFDEVRVILENLLKDDPENHFYKRNIQTSLTMIADSFAELDNLTSATEFYQKALEVSLSVANENKTNIHDKRSVAGAYIRMGDIWTDQGEYAKALDAYLKAVKIDEMLYEKDSRNMTWQYDLSISYIRVHDLYIDMGDASSAKKYGEQALSLLLDIQSNERNYFDIDDLINGLK